MNFFLFILCALYIDPKAVDGEKATSTNKSEPGRTETNRSGRWEIRKYSNIYVYYLTI